MVRDNADVLARLDAEEAALKAEEAGCGRRVKAKRGPRSSMPLLRSRRARRRSPRSHPSAPRRPPRSARSSAACAKAPSGATGSLGSSRRCRREANEIAAKIGGARRSGREDAFWWTRRQKRPKPPKARPRAPRSRRSQGARRRNGRASAGAGGARRPCPHRDGSAHAGKDTRTPAAAGASRRCWNRSPSKRGYETALGAALGEDLDAPLDRQRAGALGRRAIAAAGDPDLPDGVGSLAAVVRGARRACAPPCPDRHRRGSRGRAAAAAAEAGAAAGQPRRARCGAGTASSPAPMRRRRPRSGWRRRTGLSSLKPRPGRRRSTSRRRKPLLRKPKRRREGDCRGRKAVARRLAQRPARRRRGARGAGTSRTGGGRTLGAARGTCRGRGPGRLRPQGSRGRTCRGDAAAPRRAGRFGACRRGSTRPGRRSPATVRLKPRHAPPMTGCSAKRDARAPASGGDRRRARELEEPG